MSATNVMGQRLVSGNAKHGDRVGYSDMANPYREWVVVGTPEESVCPTYGWSQGYKLEAENGEITWSDLAQYGWVFAE